MSESQSFVNSKAVVLSNNSSMSWSCEPQETYYHHQPSKKDRICAHLCFCANQTEGFLFQYLSLSADSKHFGCQMPCYLMRLGEKKNNCKQKMPDATFFWPNQKIETGHSVMVTTKLAVPQKWVLARTLQSVITTI